MDGSQVGVFKEGNKVSFSSLLEGHDSGGLETKICLCGGLANGGREKVGILKYQP
jgi:hypothetical protein